MLRGYREGKTIADRLQRGLNSRPWEVIGGKNDHEKVTGRVKR